MSTHPKISGKPVYGENAYQHLNDFLAQKVITKVVVLCDENTQKHCVPFFFQQISVELNAEIIEIESGEAHKTIATCQQLWATLTDLGADREALLINLGGGIITDIGGFVASTFLRGIRFINVPTSLLGMVDAAIGGKTGVNREGLKNQIGLINFPEMTLIDMGYLGTLPQDQLKSGLAEMLKHGLIADESYWQKLSDLRQLSLADLEGLVQESIAIKTKITSEDTAEKGTRKLLNYGHTLGHAIETHCLENPDKESLLHGEAVAIGMILESFLSFKTRPLSEDKLTEIKEVICTTFKKVEFSRDEMKAIIALLRYDKKTRDGTVNFVLLDAIGKGKTDCQVPESLIYEAFAFYGKA